jgi:ribonuclease D
LNHLTPLEYTYIDNRSELESLASEMQDSTRVAVDIEADSLHSYYEKVCLIQITVNNLNFIIDPLIDMDFSEFIKVLSERPLVFHGGDYDLRMLRISLDFHPKAPIFDTMLAARLLGHKQLGLAALADRYIGIHLPKKGQKSDWARRPLSRSLLDYACNDTRHLFRIADILKKELIDKKREDWHIETCERMVLTSKNDSKRDMSEAWRIKGLNSLTRHQLAYLKEIWNWRENKAQKADRPPFKVMPNTLMIRLAVWAENNKPDTLENGPKLPRNCRGHRLMSLIDALKKARRLPSSEWPEHRRPTHNNDSRPELKPLILAMRSEVSRIAESLGIETSVIAPKAALASIARNNPVSIEEIMESGHLMQWQARLVEPVLKRLL